MKLMLRGIKMEIITLTAIQKILIVITVLFILTFLTRK